MTSKVFFIPWDACGTPTVKIRFGCNPKLQSQPRIASNLYSIISSSKSTNGTVQNLYRFLINLLPLKKVEIRTFLTKFVALEISHPWFRMAY